jgi:hypothetical protein
MEKSMGGIFINYRREDSSPYAGRLYDFLSQAFPENKVFMDIDAIDPGEDFIEAINATLTESRVVIAVIGPNWSNVTDKVGKRRLDNPDDYVVRELSTALESSARVIPVLVGGAEMPRTEVLPHRLQSLARRNAIEISDTRFVSDAGRLSAAITRIVRPVGESTKKKFQNLAGHPTEVTADLADKLTTLKTLVWTDYALGVPSMLATVANANEDVVFLLLFFWILILGIAAWFNVMLLRGKNWARMAYIVLFALGLPLAFTESSDNSGAELALYVVSIGITVWVIRIVFTEPVKQIYLRK